MAHGRLARSSSRFPDARRRAARYGNTRYGHKRRHLPPNLLQGINGRTDKKTRFLGGPIGILSIVAAAAGIAAIVFLIVTAITATIGVIGTMRAYKEVNADLPNAAEVVAGTFQTTRIYDRNGVPLQEVDNPDANAGWRTYISMEQMPDHFVNATVAAEDATFWTNEGVEPVAIVRGVFINISGAGSSGGSTITQQLVRAVFPEKINAMDISYTRKMREALAAYALAQEYSKTDIFTMYVNQIYYGHRAYGIEAAAQTIFEKHANELTLAEASYLAGLPQSPSYYQEYPDQAKKRQQYVLDQMVKYDYITRAEADAAFAEPLTLSDDIRTGAVSAAPHFTEYVRQYVIEHYGEDALYGGLEITTSIDLGLQQRAEEIVAAGVQEMTEYGRNNGAMVVMVPWSGEVLAMVGSADFNNALINGEVNYATAQIQPGSSMKPLVYAMAFEQGWNPGTVLMDIPTQWDVDGESEPYEPQNYSGNFYGAVTVREALANSFNIPAVKATEFVGVQNVMDTSREMGLVDSLEQDAGFYGLSIGLGGAEVQLLEHTNAYATLANNGTHVGVHPILSIRDTQGNELFNLDSEQIAEDSNQAIPAGNAYQVTSILTDNDARSMVFGSDNRFGNTQQELGRPVAAKSGTTDEWKDLWTMGYTTDVAIGVWVGVSGGAPNTGLEAIDGIQAAGPIWQNMMYEVHRDEFAPLLVGPDDRPLPEEFPVPSDAYEGEICAVTGQRPGTGETTEEWLVRDQGPERGCTDLDTRERTELDKAVAATREGNTRWAGNAVERIARYASAVGVSGVDVPDDEDDDAPQSDQPTGETGSTGVIEPVNNQPDNPPAGATEAPTSNEPDEPPPSDDGSADEPTTDEPDDGQVIEPNG
jgi:membrane peptidoglycan carboxypeptidase